MTELRSPLAWESLQWQRRAACAGKSFDFFGPEGPREGYGQARREAAAKQICNTICPVRVVCLAWALDKPEPHGVWGGMSEREREHLTDTQQADLIAMAAALLPRA